MKLENSFDVPVSVDQVWPVLVDLERIAPCLPGASIVEAEGNSYRGTVKIKAGPMTVNYGGLATLTSVDESTHSVIMDASGKETRGSGTVRVSIAAQVEPTVTGSHVTVVTDLAITGKPAQLGRGLIADVGGKIIDEFAANLSAQILAPPVAVPADATASTPGVSPPAPSPPTELDMMVLLRPYLLRGAGLGVVLALALRRWWRR